MRIGACLSIRLRLILAVGCLAVIALGATGQLAWQARRVNASSAASLSANGIADLLIKAAGHLALERGMTTTSLNGAAAATADTVAAIARQRTGADEATAQALSAVAALPEAAESASRVAALQRNFASLRSDADAALAQPRPHRPEGLAGRVFGAATALIEASQDLRRAASYEGDSTESRLARLPQLKNAAWIMSEFAGRERAGLGAAIAAGTPIPPERMIDFGINRGKVEAAWTEIDAFVRRPDAPAAIRDAAAAVRNTFFGSFQALRAGVYTAGAKDGSYPVDAATWIREATAAIDTVLALSRAIGSEAASVASQAADSGHRGIVIALSALAAGLAIAIGAVLIATMQVARPLMRMAEATRRLASGELTTVIEGRHRRDELGTLAAAIAVLQSGMVQKRELEREQADAAALREREQDAARHHAAREAADASMVVETIGAALTRMADRDLSNEHVDELPVQYQRIRTDLILAIHELRSALLSVVENADNISANSASIATASDQLSTRSQRQAANIEQALAALAHLSSTVRNTAENAINVSLVINKTKADAEQSNTSMEQAVSIMDAILISSRRIGEVTSIIDEMAFQTNLLALNAGVEAARAGDAGRGFAVVAAEVRALAQRSAAAAKEIRGLITESGKQVESGVRRVGDAENALSRILSHVSQITHSVATIAEAGKDQAKSLHEFNAAVTELESSAEKDAAMGEEMAAATNELNQDSVTLVELTRRFQLGDANSRRANPTTYDPSRQLSAILA